LESETWETATQSADMIPVPLWPWMQGKYRYYEQNNILRSPATTFVMNRHTTGITVGNQSVKNELMEYISEAINEYNRQTNPVSEQQETTELTQWRPRPFGQSKWPVCYSNVNK